PGLLWQVGFNTQLGVLERPWVPGDQEPYFPMPRVPVLNLRDVHVSSLILHQAWDRSRLRELFDPPSVHAIESIPLPRTLHISKPIWFFSASGQYPTSSGYDFATRLKKKKKKKPLPSLASATDPALWRSVWSLRVQPKLRFFLWRLCHRILPTIEGLNSRKNGAGSPLPSLSSGPGNCRTHSFLMFNY
ncbi:hypothetical protein LINPERHAP1_LOCUS10027, partial [Linum perenne]